MTLIAVVEEPRFLASDDGIDLVSSFLNRFLAYPSDHALVAHTLWIAHTHLFEEFDTTPRLAFMSAEPMSGKTRALEITNLLAHEPILSFSMSAAVAVRLVAARRRAVLYDEIDAVYGNTKRQEGNADLIGFMNAGYRRGAKFYRCDTGNGSRHEPIEYDAFAPLAVAGLRSLPDALATRAIIIRLRRRAPDEQVEPSRPKIHDPQALPIRQALEEWCVNAAVPPEPELPECITDRAADIWEPLIAIADAYGGDWPERARAAAVHFTKANAEDEARSSGVELLAHIKEAFGGEQHISSEELIRRLCARDESPWTTANRGHEIDQVGLSRRLKPYGIKSTKVRFGPKSLRGYRIDMFVDAWTRYLPTNPEHLEHPEHLSHCNNLDVPPVPPVPPSGEGEGIPHPVYGPDEFSSLRKPDLEGEPNDD